MEGSGHPYSFFFNSSQKRATSNFSHEHLWNGFSQSINQSIKKITTYKNDHWCTTNLRAKIKSKDNVQNVKTRQR